MDVESVVTNYIAYLLAGSCSLIPRREDERVSAVLPGWSWGVLLRESARVSTYLTLCLSGEEEDPYNIDSFDHLPGKNKRGMCM